MTPQTTTNEHFFPQQSLSRKKHDFHGIKVSAGNTDKKVN